MQKLPKPKHGETMQSQSTLQLTPVLSPNVQSLCADPSIYMMVLMLMVEVDTNKKPIKRTLGGSRIIVEIQQGYQIARTEDEIAVVTHIGE